MEIPMENVEAGGDKVEPVGDLDIPLSTETTVDFGETLSLIDQVSSKLSIARNSDEEPALAVVCKKSL